MNINATLILQSIAMMIFVWFCMKFIWPPLLKAMDERRAKVADGLAASDLAEKELEAAKLTLVSRSLKHVIKQVRFWTRPISVTARFWIRPKRMPVLSVSAR